MARGIKTQPRVFDTDNANTVCWERHQASLRGHKYFKSQIPARFGPNNPSPWRNTRRGQVVPASEVPRKIKDWYRNGCPEIKTKEVDEKALEKELEKVLKKYKVSGKIKLTIEV